LSSASSSVESSTGGGGSGEYRCKVDSPDLTTGSTYTDSADSGKDYLCSIAYGVYGSLYYVLDVYYTNEPATITEEETAKFLARNRVKVSVIESNSAGKSFARNVEEYCKKMNYSCTFEWFYNGGNKETRIDSNSADVQKRIVFPSNWYDRWPKFYEHVIDFQRVGANQKDDGPDCMTGIIEDLGASVWKAKIRVT